MSTRPYSNGPFVSDTVGLAGGGGGGRPGGGSLGTPGPGCVGCAQGPSGMEGLRLFEDAVGPALQCRLLQVTPDETVLLMTSPLHHY